MTRRAHVALFGLFAVLALPACATAQASANPLAEFQRREALVHDTGWQLARANRAFCERTSPSIGLLIHDARNYAQAGEVRRALSLVGDIGVQAVAVGSPAQKAGIAANWSVIAIDGEPVTSRWRPTSPSSERTLQIERAIVDSLANGEVTLQLRRGSANPVQITLRGVASCSAKFRLTSGDDPYAGPDTVFVGHDFHAFGMDRAELAAAIAHELAHVLLDHPRKKEAERWGMTRTRASERVADRMMPWILWNAGYDPHAAARWMRAWGPKHSGGILRKRTHDGWDERLETIEAEIAALESLVSENGWSRGQADWSARFSAD